MSNHHFHRSAGPFTILLFHFHSTRFQTKVFASRVAKPECRTTIFTCRPAVFASRVAKPECRTAISTSRPDRLLFYYLISTPLGSKQRVFASRVAKPECRTTIFTCRPALFASRVAKPECRTTIFTGRPDRLLFYYFTISFPFGSRSPRVFLHLGQLFLHVEPPILHTRPPHPIIFQRFLCISDSLFCMSAHVFACRPNVSLHFAGSWLASG